MPYKKDDLVEVTVMLFPDGTNYWFLSNMDFANQINAAWKENQPKEKLQFYQDNEVFTQLVVIKMLRKDYFKIQPTIIPGIEE